MKRPTARRGAFARGSIALLIGALAGISVPFAGAQDKPSATASRSDAGELGDAEAKPADPATLALLRTTDEVRDLLAGKLDPAVSPASLFDISMDSEQAISLEAERIGALLREVDSAAQSSKASKAKPEQTKKKAELTDGGAGLPEIEPALWDARVGLDRARLAFYRLSADQRTALLAAQSKRQKASAAPPESDTARREREANEERERALAAARQARTEVERLVSEEHARLLDVEGRQAAFSAKLDDQRKDLADRREATLKWQRKARELRDGNGNAGDTVDEGYGDLRKTLREARDGLAAALSAPSSDEIPGPGPDSLANLGADTDTSVLRAERAKLEKEARALAIEDAAVHEERLTQLFDETTLLNEERLGLLPFLSPARRSAITGFTDAGLDQATSEARQLSLILRYHRHVSTQWLRALRDPGQGLDKTAARGVWVLLEWAAATAFFLWWRRRAPPTLFALIQQAEVNDRAASLSKPSLTRRALLFAAHVRRPLEWLAILFVLGWLLPDDARSLLEFQLPFVTLTWTFVGAFIVNSVDALAGTGALPGTTDATTAALRLRSLRLVGRLVVIFGLILVISSRLVGQGTIYRWVFSTCWFASFPVFLILIRWWKHVVFARVELARRPSAFERWVLANKTGWTSFLAASAGGVYLFGYGTERAVRGWVGGFEITRRGMAYLFRRELDKMGADESDLALGPISPESFAELGPETESAQWIDTHVDADLDALVKRLRSRRGGVVAIVGERGMGKTSALHRARAAADGVPMLDTPAEGLDAFSSALAPLLGLAADASLDMIAEHLGSTGTPGILIDNLHRFVQPVMGGMASFDRLLALAGQTSARTTWVFTIDDVVWQFLERARGARPLFDEVIRLDRWREQDIVRILCARTVQAELSPSFEHLLEALPAGADDIDRREAVDRRSASYYRLLWDYASGNPGVALHAWRRSLGQDTDGKTWVRIFQAPDTRDFERLPDSTLFVLKAVLQLSPAAPAAIARATLLRAAEIEDALRYALARGYLEETEGSYRVTWTWFRPTTLFLQRRHLLVSP